jgi:hypothetical protein
MTHSSKPKEKAVIGSSTRTCSLADNTRTTIAQTLPNGRSAILKGLRITPTKTIIGSQVQMRP